MTRPPYDGSDSRCGVGMSKDRIEPSEHRPGALHRPRPPYGWMTMGLIGLGLAALAPFLARHSFEHVAQDRYLGPGQCKECHPRQFESWATTRMAASFSVLRPGEKAQEKRSVGLDPSVDYTHNEACLPCHSTGYGRPGGFVSVEATPEMAGVTCESCHGPGGAYAGTVMAPGNSGFLSADARKAGLVYPPAEPVCRICHNSKSPFAPTDGKFDFAARVRIGTHQHFKLKYGHGD